MSLLALTLASVFLQSAEDAPGHWPQWRGPNRDNVSTETGLLKEWPEGGPKLLWSTTELGDGMPPVTVGGGRIYGIGYRADAEYVTSLNGGGSVVWSVPVGPLGGEMPSMRFLSQRPVTIDDDRVYAVTVGRTLFCLKSLDGSIVWKRSYADLGASPMGFLFSDTPMVDGEFLICKPGGPQGHVACLDKRTGNTVWRSTEFTDRADHAPLIPAEIGGMRQYLVLSMNHVAGIDAKDGKRLWSADFPGKTAVASTPAYKDGILFVSCGFGVGCHAYQITTDGGTFQAKEIYAGRQMESHRGGFVIVGDHVYGTDGRGLQCVELKTGAVAWQDRCVGKCTICAADGRLIVRGELNGMVALVEASPAGYHEISRFVQSEVPKEVALPPVVAGGRLYLRDPRTLVCYDLRGTDYRDPSVVWKTPGNAPRPVPKPPVPLGPKTDAAFVATPHDVVRRMLELAKVGKNDVVVDLGSGDGRIVLAAARDYGCKAVGFEIEPDLVKKSREEIAKAKLESLATIEEKDLFTADLSGATVVTLYLGAPNNARLLPQLRKLPPRSRIVSHQHRLGEAGPEPDERVVVVSNDDPDPHVIYLWTTPLKDDK